MNFLFRLDIKDHIRNVFQVPPHLLLYLFDYIEFFIIILYHISKFSSIVEGYDAILQSHINNLTNLDLDEIYFEMLISDFFSLIQSISCQINLKVIIKYVEDFIDWLYEIFGPMVVKVYIGNNKKRSHKAPLKMISSKACFYCDNIH